MSETVLLGVWTDGVHTMVAADEADARAVYAEAIGALDAEYATLRAVDPTTELSIYDDEAHLPHGAACPGCGFGLATSLNGHQRGCRIGCPTKTAAQWAAGGRGFLCSTER